MSEWTDRASEEMQRHLEGTGAAVLGETRGPWWAVTVASREG